jgi:exopolysaccharide production protein ExoY
MMLYVIAKRILDFIVASVLWIIFSPLMLLIAILIKLYDGGEVFVGTPMRNGINGKHFFMYKFRTMVPNAYDLISQNKEMKEELLSSHKLSSDQRVTRIGRILRNTDLDEIPQLINVILGHMSLVGPRPYYDDEVDYHLNMYPDDRKYFENIFRIKPGITGIWQISGRNEIDFPTRIRMESEYALTPNFLFDLSILFKTPWVVISRKGVKGTNG